MESMDVRRRRRTRDEYCGIDMRRRRRRTSDDGVADAHDMATAGWTRCSDGGDGHIMMTTTTKSSGRGCIYYVHDDKEGSATT